MQTVQAVQPCSLIAVRADEQRVLRGADLTCAQHSSASIGWHIDDIDVRLQPLMHRVGYLTVPPTLPLPYPYPTPNPHPNPNPNPNSSPSPSPSPAPDRCSGL